MSHESEADFNLEHSLVSKTAEAAIASQIESAENIEVDLDSKVSQLVRGDANSLKIKGEKIIAVRDIQLEQVDITCDDLSLNLTQAILGKIAFEQPGDFQVKLVFTESDCDRLLNSEYVKILFQNLPLDLDRQSSFHLEEPQCQLLDGGKVCVTARVVLNQGQQCNTAKFKIAFKFERDGTAIIFDGGEYLDEQGMDLDETVAIMGKIRDLLYLRHYSNSDLSFDISRIEIQAQQLIVQGNVRIEKLPESISLAIETVASDIKHN